MKRFFQSEIGAAVAWVLCSLVLAAVIAPWVYQGGKHLAFLALSDDLPAPLEWLGAACERSRFGRFFDRSMLFSALVLLPLLYRRIRKLRSTIPYARENPLAGIAKRDSLVQIAAGAVIAGGLFLGMGALLNAAGVYVPEDGAPGLGRLVSKALVPAVAASLLEEWLFRGLLLGMWLRSARTATACVGTSVLFSFLHFLKPPAGTVIADPSHALAGFELLGKILLHFTDPLFFVADFASLLLAGLILAWARVRTGALWFSIGIHGGWILAFKAFNLYYQKVPGHPLGPWGVGENLRSGIIPLATLGITAVACHFALKWLEALSRASR